jgi:putative ATP-dependent endonuclease of OLD family
MNIESVHIKNFRTLKDVIITFDTVTTFIGPNGAGKSTVLHALDWFFNGKSGSLTEKDCSFGATDENIEVRVTFTDLTETDREALGKYAPDDVTTFTAWKLWFPEGSDVLSANAKGFPEFNVIKTAIGATAKKESYAELKNRKPELGLPAATTGPAVEQAMMAWEASHTAQLVDTPEILQTNFFGFNSSGKMSGLFDFVLVTADLRAREESIDGKSSIIARILERSVNRMAADEAIALIVEEARVKQQEVYAHKFKTQLDDMTLRLNSVISSYAPGRAVTVSPSEVELKAPRTTFEVAVLDGATETAVERQGHGFQRTILISALQLLAQSGSASEEGVICLAIEEPELFQHPIQAQAFAKVLRSLTEDANKRIQVTYATHSPYFLEARYFHQVRRLTRTSDETPVVTVHYTTIAAVKTKLQGIVDPDVVDRRLDHNVADQLSIALFANQAFLVEGPTESSVFYGISDRVVSGSLEAAGVSIVHVGAKASIPLAHAILTLIGVPVYALFDADGGAEARGMANGKDPKKINDDRNNNIKQNRDTLKYFGLAEEDFPSSKVYDQVAIFEDHLESFMQENWPEWITACKEVEDEVGMKLAKNKLAYRTATLQAQGSVPEMLLTILTKAKGK